MGAVKSHPRLSDPDKLVARYGGVPIVYVESDEDNYVFGECWFRDRLTKVEFRSARTKCACDGCNAVINAVAEERAAGILAWGIVDRDTVMAKEIWTLVHETDDTLYENAKPFGDNIKVLRRWELESYLIDAESLEYFGAALAKKLERPLAVVTQELIDHCHALAPIAAINAALHDCKKPGLGDGYAIERTSQMEVDSDIRARHVPRLSDQTKYTHFLPLVLAFDAPAEPPETRLLCMLRRIHGKALLLRFLRISHKVQYDIKPLLARRIKEKSRVPQELTKFIDHVTTCLE